VEFTSLPDNPVGGEQVARVESVTVDDAARRFRAIHRPDLAELYALAAQVRAEEHR